jgi:hypothetical protein
MENVENIFCWGGNEKWSELSEMVRTLIEKFEYFLGGYPPALFWWVLPPPFFLGGGGIFGGSTFVGGLRGEN